MRRLRPAIATLAFLVAFVVLPSSALGAISFVAMATSQNATGSTSLAISKPTGVAEGDVMIAAVTAAGTGTITAPSGWTAIKNVTVGTTMRQLTMYKVAVASEPTSYSWSLGTSRAASGGIVDYRGVNQTVPIDATGSATGTSGNATAPSVTTSAAADQVLGVGSFAAVTTVTPASGTTERFDVSSLSNTSELADLSQASAGASGAKTITPLLGTASWIAQTVALRDASQATLAVSTSAAPTFSAGLDSGDQAKTYTVPLTVNDTRTGSSAGLGWNLTITSTQFTSGTKTLPSGASTVTGVTSACANGGLCTEPTNSIGYPVAVPAGAGPPTAVKFYNAAAGTGKGLFTSTPTVSVAVPQNSFAGTYTSTLTISVVSGP
ncbi:MAG: hypothetical protein JSS97_14950 [Actinobacteria bacterium]|nr:hypothetical protein [Actinomycetota bacterium]